MSSTKNLPPGTTKEPRVPKPVMLAPDVVHNILKSRYTDGLTVGETCKLHKISQGTWSSINTQYAPTYKERYGARKLDNALTAEQMTQFWDSKK